MAFSKTAVLANLFLGLSFLYGGTLAKYVTDTDRKLDPQQVVVAAQPHGKLSHTERTHAGSADRSLFAILDKDSDGVISMAELTWTFGTMDVNGDNKLSLDELEAGTQLFDKQGGQKQLGTTKTKDPQDLQGAFHCGPPGDQMQLHENFAVGICSEKETCTNNLNSRFSCDWLNKECKKNRCISTLENADYICKTIHQQQTAETEREECIEGYCECPCVPTKTFPNGDSCLPYLDFCYTATTSKKPQKVKNNTNLGTNAMDKGVCVLKEKDCRETARSKYAKTCNEIQDATVCEQSMARPLSKSLKEWFTENHKDIKLHLTLIKCHWVNAKFPHPVSGTDVDYAGCYESKTVCVKELPW